MKDGAAPAGRRITAASRTYSLATAVDRKWLYTSSEIWDGNAVISALVHIHLAALLIASACYKPGGTFSEIGESTQLEDASQVREVGRVSNWHSFRKQSGRAHRNRTPDLDFKQATCRKRCACPNHEKWRGGEAYRKKAKHAFTKTVFTPRLNSA